MLYNLNRGILKLKKRKKYGKEVGSYLELYDILKSENNFKKDESEFKNFHQ